MTGTFCISSTLAKIKTQTLDLHAYPRKQCGEEKREEKKSNNTKRTESVGLLEERTIKQSHFQPSKPLLLNHIRGRYSRVARNKWSCIGLPKMGKSGALMLTPCRDPWGIPNADGFGGYKVLSLKPDHFHSIWAACVTRSQFWRLANILWTPDQVRLFACILLL